MSSNLMMSMKREQREDCSMLVVFSYEAIQLDLSIDTHILIRSIHKR